MGLFYTNMTLFRPERSAALAELRRLKRAALLSPSFEGHTVVFDEAIEEQNTEAIEELGKQITKALSCAAMTAVLHDDDILYLWLFENGKLLDHYNSCPAYFDDSLNPEPTGGDSKLICRAFGRQDRTEQVEKLLRMDVFSPESEIPGEQERHAALAVELGMPPFVAGLCYSSIAGGYILDEFKGPTYERV